MNSIKRKAVEEGNEEVTERPNKRIRRSRSNDSDEETVVQHMTTLHLNQKETMSDASTEDTTEEEDDEPTYIVTDGRLKGYEVALVSKKADSDNKVEVSTLKNARGKNMRDPVKTKLHVDSLREKDSYDMLDFSQGVDDANEDSALLQHEKATWNCPKCDGSVSNENGFCPAMIDGEPCGSAPRTPEGGPIGWGGCFAITEILTNTWKCEHCTTRNNVEDDTCAACETDRS